MLNSQQHVLRPPGLAEPDAAAPQFRLDDDLAQLDAGAKTEQGIYDEESDCALSLAAGAAVAAEAPADLVLRDAKVYTANAKHAMAEAVAVRGGRIVYVGSNDGATAYVGPSTHVEDLKGKLVLPGLVDSHIHASLIVDLDVCDLKSAAKSLAELTSFVRGCIERYKVPAGQWVQSFSSGITPAATYPMRNVRRSALPSTWPRRSTRSSCSATTDIMAPSTAWRSPAHGTAPARSSGFTKATLDE